VRFAEISKRTFVVAIFGRQYPLPHLVNRARFPLRRGDTNATERRQLASVIEAARYLRIRPQTLYRMLERGEIPPGTFKVGSVWRLDLDELVGFLQKRTRRE